MLKSVMALSLVILTLLLCACQTTEMTIVPEAQRVTHPQPNKALVMFVRPQLLGGAVQATVYDNDHYIGTVSAKNILPYQTKAGKHFFMVVGENADFLSANLLPNKTYYVEIVSRPGMFKTRFSFRPYNDQIPLTEIKKWIANTRQVKVNAKGLAWFAAHKAAIMAKKAEYIPKWNNRPKDKRKTIHADSGF